MKKEKKGAVRGVRIRWVFDDESVETMPLAEHVDLLQKQYHVMAANKEPSVRDAGRNLLQGIWERAAARQWDDIQRAQNAKNPRTKSAIKERIQTMMRPYKVSGTQFKVFLQAWEREALDGLRLKVDGDSYAVDDEESNAEPTSYKLGSLSKLYSTS